MSTERELMEAELAEELRSYVYIAGADLVAALPLMSPFERYMVGALLDSRLKLASVERERDNLAEDISAAARAIPEVSGPVEQRINWLRDSLSASYNAASLKLAAAEKLAAIILDHVETIEAIMCDKPLCGHFTAEEIRAELIGLRSALSEYSKTKQEA